MKKFQINDTVTYTMLYGGMVTVKIVSRTDNTVSWVESWVSEDDGSLVEDNEIHTGGIIFQDTYNDDYTEVIGKVESVEVWEYKGHKGFMYAVSCS